MSLSVPSAPEAPPLVVCASLEKTFEAVKGQPPVTVLRNVSLQVHPGEMVAIVGPSGSGKSTLLYCLSGLEPVSGGGVSMFGQDISALGRNALAKMRRDRVGFIFQSYNLVPSLTAMENAALPARIARKRGAAADARAAVDAVGLTERGGFLPGKLSGGQQQRVAIARVLASGASIVFADEPTGALDTVTGAQVLSLLRETASGSRSVVLVTHDLEAAARADRVLVLRDGSIHAELRAPSAQQVLDAVRAAGEESLAA
ncbi:ABC transporter ATP-binding protein [Microbacterium sp. CH-015]|uniref:ABC transporter ATP-binding protein n=1 Tax=Microbacterium sp. CH-015 TaxID=3406734 RepID=UPI003C759158